MAKIAIVGAGAWGTALAAHAARLEHDVRIWAREPEVAREIDAEHVNTPFLAGARLPKTLRGSHDLAYVVAGAEIVLLVPPSSHLRAAASAAAPHVSPTAAIVIASKGIEEGSLALMSEVIAEAMPSSPPPRVAFLSGPSFAREVASGLPTDVVVASHQADVALRVQEVLHSPLFRVYTSDDPVGVQIGGAVKNVVAVAAGACEGLGFGMNARAALITRGLAEITRLGVARGADPLTFLGMAGVGDLVLTCTGALSRNHALGLKVAEGADPRAYLASQRTVAEGFNTSAATYALAQKLGVDMPITEQVYHVLHEGRPLLEALKLLLTRAFKSELLGIQASRGAG